jgi:hypothetical protein
MHPRTRELLSYLEERRAELRAAFDAVPAREREARLEPEQWSVAEVIEHLSIAERRLAKVMAARVDEARANGLPTEQETTPIVPLVDTVRMIDRTTRVEAPGLVKPTGSLDAEAAWSALETAGARLRRAIESCDGLAIGGVSLAHPLFGPMNMYEWIVFTGAHEARHAAQIREIGDRLAARA